MGPRTRTHLQSSELNPNDENMKNIYKKERKKESLFEPYGHTQHDLIIQHCTEHTLNIKQYLFSFTRARLSLSRLFHISCHFAYGSRHRRPQDIRKLHQPMVPANFIPKTFKLLALHEEMG